MLRRIAAHRPTARLVESYYHWRHSQTHLIGDAREGLRMHKRAVKEAEAARKCILRGVEMLDFSDTTELIGLINTLIGTLKDHYWYRKSWLESKGFFGVIRQMWWLGGWPGQPQNYGYEKAAYKEVFSFLDVPVGLVEEALDEGYLEVMEHIKGKKYE